MAKVISASLASVELIRSAHLSRWAHGRGWPDGKPLPTRRRTDRAEVQSVRDRLWDVQGGRCAYCLRNLTRGILKADGSVPDSSATVDHVHPRSRGGTSERSNLVLACYGCNQRKGDSTSWTPVLKSGNGRE